MLVRVIGRKGVCIFFTSLPVNVGKDELRAVDEAIVVAKHTLKRLG
jgi:hypothetical protein